MARIAGRRIKQRREELGMTQEYLAEKIKVSQKSISDYEGERRTNMETDTLIALAEILKKPIGFFFEADINEDGAEGAILNEFRSLPSDASRQFAIKLLRELRSYSQVVEKRGKK